MGRHHFNLLNILRGRVGVAPLILAALAVTSSACKSGYPVAAKQTSEARQVQTAPVAEVPMERSITVTGTLAAYEQATISAKVAGRVRAINVDLGSVVRKGQVIAQLEPRDYQLRLEQAEAALAQARARLGLSPDGPDDRVDPENTATVRQAKAMLEEARLKFERSKNLVRQGVIARSQLDTDEAEYKVAQSRYQDAIEEIRNRQGLLLQRRSEVDLARQQLADSEIKAAFDGVVEQRQVSPGEYLASGAPVVTVVKNNPLRLRAEVPEREARRVRAGLPVRVTVEGDASVYTGRVARLSPSISEQTRVLLIEAEVINNGQLRPGAFVRAEIVTEGGGRTVAVPASALVSFAGIEKVITIQDGKAAEKPVTTGRRTAEYVEILTGVKTGDAVVIDPGNLQSGMPVVVKE